MKSGRPAGPAAARPAVAKVGHRLATCGYYGIRTHSLLSRAARCLATVPSDPFFTYNNNNNNIFNVRLNRLLLKVISLLFKATKYLFYIKYGTAKVKLFREDILIMIMMYLTSSWTGHYLRLQACYLVLLGTYPT